jgi:hypothetical protein
MDKWTKKILLHFCCGLKIFRIASTIFWQFYFISSFYRHIFSSNYWLTIVPVWRKLKQIEENEVNCDIKTPTKVPALKIIYDFSHSYTTFETTPAPLTLFCLRYSCQRYSLAPHLTNNSLFIWLIFKALNQGFLTRDPRPACGPPGRFIQSASSSNS